MNLNLDEKQVSLIKVLVAQEVAELKKLSKETKCPTDISSYTRSIIHYNVILRECEKALKHEDDISKINKIVAEVINDELNAEAGIYSIDLIINDYFIDLIIND